MKRSTMKWMIVAAALAVAAGTASAQDLKADIPFTFHAGAVMMAPGTYAVNVVRSGSLPHVMLRNAETGKAVMLTQYSFADPSKATRAIGVPMLQFECAGARCALRELWQGSYNAAYHFQGPNFGRGEDIHTAAIAMTRVKAD